MNIYKYKNSLLRLAPISILIALFILGNKPDLSLKILAWSLIVYSAMLFFSFIITNDFTKKITYYISWIELLVITGASFANLLKFFGWINSPSAHNGTPLFLVPIAFLFAALPLVTIIIPFGVIKVSDPKKEIISSPERTVENSQLEPSKKILKVSGIINLLLGLIILLGYIANPEDLDVGKVIIMAGILISGVVFLTFSMLKSKSIIINYKTILPFSIISILSIFGIPMGLLSLYPYIKINKLVNN